MGRFAKRIVLNAVAIAAAAVVAPAHADTLQEAIALAYETNPTLQDQRAQLRVVDETYVQARAGYRPTVSLTAGATTQDIEGRDADQGQAALVLTQPLYTGGRTSGAVSASRADILSGRESLRQVEASVIQKVIQAYVDVRRDQAALAIRGQDFQVLTRELEDMRTRFAVADVTRTDVAQAEASAAQARALLSSAQAQLEITRATYAAVVGRPAGQLEPEPVLASPAATLDQALGLAEKSNAALRAARYVQEAAHARVAEARAERMPQANLRLELGHSTPLTNLQSKLIQRSLTATVNVVQPLSAGGAINSRVRQAIERENSARVRVEAARRDLVQQLSQAWSVLIATRSNIEANEVQVRSARIAFEGTQEERKLGLRTTLEVLSAQQNLSAAQLTLLNSRRDSYLAEVTLLSVIGQLEAAFLAPEAKPYDPVRAFNRHRFSGFVPWEPVVSIVDSLGVPKPKILPPPRPATPPTRPAKTPARR